MEHRQIEEDQLIERYVMGQLDENLAERFEEHFLSCPRCLQEVEMGERFHFALKGVAAEEAAQAVAGAGLLAMLARLLRSPGAGLAVAAALVIALLPAALLWRQVGRLDGELDSLRGAGQILTPRANPPLLYLSPSRSLNSATADTRLTLSSSPEWIVLVLELDGSAATPHRATLSGPTGDVLWQSDELLPDAAGSFTLGLPSSYLSAGDHELRLQELAEGAPAAAVARFAFRVVAPAD